MAHIFVNGDSHTAQVYGTPGPTATQILAERFDCTIENLAKPGGSNQRIIRTTQERLKDLDPLSTVIIIGWSSMERTEWFCQGEWHDISGSSAYPLQPAVEIYGRGHVDGWTADLNHETWRRHQDQHHAIWVFHRLLHDLGYHFIFYQGCRAFFFDRSQQQNQSFYLPWIDGVWLHKPYIHPHEGLKSADSFSYWCHRQGFAYTDEHAHFGADAHRAWADRLSPMFVDKLSKLKKR